MRTSNVFLGLVLAGVATLSYGGKAAAQIAPQTCDVGVWRTMEDRARLETQREVMQNQNLIFKADSVLSYTCFDMMAAHAVQTVGPLFTHTSYWGQQIIPWAGRNGVPGLGGAVQNAVISSMQQYITGNFNHSPLGGRGAQLGLSTPTVRSVPAQGTSYACSQMSTVWNAAKCMNFMHTAQFAENDGYYPFVSLQAGPGGGTPIEGYDDKSDVRQFPTACGSISTPSGTQSVSPVPGGWDGLYNASRNSPDGSTFDLRYQYGTPTGTSFRDVRRMIGAGTVSAGPGAGTSICAPPVLTGVTIILSPGSTDSYQDGVCVTPGCTYTRSGTGGTCS